MHRMQAPYYMYGALQEGTLAESPAGAVITAAADRAAAARRRSDATGIPTSEGELVPGSGEANEDGNCAVM